MNFFIFNIFINLLLIKFCQSATQNDLAASLLNRQGINNCIVVNSDIRDVNDEYQNVKYYAIKNIYTTYMDADSFIFYLLWKHYLNIKTAVLIPNDVMLKIFQTQQIVVDMTFDEMMRHFTWIIFDESIYPLLKRFYIPYDCEFFLITTINESYYEIDDVYNVGPDLNSRQQRHQLGYWSRGELAMTSVTKAQRRFDMMGEIVTIIDVDFNLCQVFDPECCNSIILKDIGIMMNSTTISYYWSNNINNQIQSKLVAYSLSLVYDPRNTIMRFMLGSIRRYNGYFYIKDITGDQYRISAYFAPFSKAVWHYITLSLLVSSIASLMIEHWSWLEHQNITAAILRPFETLCNQYGSQVSENISSRLACLSVQIIASILVPAYSAFVISYLTVYIPKLPFEDLESLIQDGTYKTSGVNGTYSHTFLRNSFNSISREITSEFLLKNTPMHEEEGREWICKKDFKYAFLAFNNSLDEIPQDDCKILQIPKPIFSVHVGVLMKPYSPYLEAYKTNLYRFYTNGMLHKMEKDLSIKMRERYKEDYVPLTLNRIGPLLCIVIFGIAFGIAILILEMLWKKKNNPRKSKYILSGWHVTR